MTEHKFEFKEVNDDVNALVWLPNSACEMLAATEDNLMMCDTRQTWTINKVIDHGNNKKIYDIKFDPFNSNQFATKSEDKIKIYDLRNPKKGPLYTLQHQSKSSLAGFEWAQYRSGLLATWLEQSKIVNFWDLNQQNIEMQPKPSAQVSVTSGDIWALAWRTRHSNVNQGQAYNKFYVLTS